MEKKLTAPRVIAQACEKADVPFTHISKDRIVTQLHLPKNDHLIINFDLGLINSSDTHLCKDKAYQYELLHQTINLPPTRTYLDPHGKYGHLAKIKSIPEIVGDIESNFSLPVIVKMNQGSEGMGVYLCHNHDEIERAVSTIFSHQNWEYDYVLLAQKYIKPAAEYRAVFYKQQPEIVYLKDAGSGEYVGNLSPLHFAGAKAIDIEDNALRQKVSNFVAPIFDKIRLKYAGLDIIVDHEQQWWLIEINSAPAFGYYLENNSDQKVVELFSKIFSDLKNE